MHALCDCEYVSYSYHHTNGLLMLAVLVPVFTTMRVWALYGKINVIVVLAFLCSFFVPIENMVSRSNLLSVLGFAHKL